MIDPAARFRRWTFGATVAAFAVTGLPRAADAAVLLAVRAEIAPGKNARATLAFTGGVPTFRIYGNGTNDVTVILVGTTRGPAAPATIIGKDTLRSINVDPVGDSLDVSFHATVATTVNVAVGSGQTLVATATASAPPASPKADTGIAPAAPAPAPLDTTGNSMEVVLLKYADVSEIVGLLVPGQQITSNDTFAPQAQGFGAPGLSNGGFGGGLANGVVGGNIGFNPAQNANVQNFAAIAGGGAGSLGQQINENVGVDRRLNAIILTGPPETIARYKAKIAQLDVPLSSVVLETQVVELTDTAARDVGIDFTNGGGAVAGATYQIKSLTSGTGTINLQAAVYAQVTRGQGRVIARPRVVAQNGGSAQIITGDALPIVTSIAVSGVNAVSQQVQYVNVGVNLQISPRISSDGFVTSHIFSEISSVTGYQQGYPTLSQREATTAATVRDGEAFVIGGLLQQNDISNLSKVPGIGDLPLIGNLFRIHHDTRTSTNLYIIVVPHILTNGNPAPANLPVPPGALAPTPTGTAAPRP